VHMPSRQRIRRHVLAPQVEKVHSITRRVTRSGNTSQTASIVVAFGNP